MTASSGAKTEKKSQQTGFILSQQTANQVREIQNCTSMQDHIILGIFHGFFYKDMYQDFAFDDVRYYILAGSLS